MRALLEWLRRLFAPPKREQQHVDVARMWNRHHTVLIDGSCAICGAIDVDPDEYCPGPGREVA